jgi:hypothetical protein
MRTVGPEPRKKPKKPKQTVYTIHTSPTETRELKIRGRARPRKARLALIKQFNQIVKSGLCSGLQFNEFGAFTGVERWNRVPTTAEKEVFEQVIRLTHELTHRLERVHDSTYARANAFNRMDKVL